MVAKSVVAPFDRIKILYQVTNAEFRLRKVPSVARTIIDTEGWTALWKGNTATLIEQLEKFDIDFAVVANVPSSNAFSARLLREDPLVAFVPFDHPWAKRQSIELAELTTGPLVLREQGSETRRIVEDKFTSLGLSATEVISIEGREAAREAVAQGLGVGIVSAGEFIEDPRLKRIDIAGWQASMREWLVCLKSRESLHLVQAVLKIVDENYSL